MLKFLSKLIKKDMTEEKKDTENLQEDGGQETSVEKTEEAVEQSSKITYDDFKKVEIKVGEIISAEKVENADRLFRLEVSFGNETRQIVSGISEYYNDPQEIVGKKVPFVTNLEPRKIRGLESDGMIMAAIDRESNNFSMLEINNEIPAGTNIS